jgi:acetolactate decarboxylase
VVHQVRFSPPVWEAALEERARTGESVSEVVDRLVGDALGLQRHTLFQVSTSTALAEGVFAGEMTVEQLLGHGDFGIGTYDRLDGELVLIDGRCFRAGAGGRLEEAAPSATVPFAIVTHFTVDRTIDVDHVASLEELAHRIDAIRPSENVFVAVRVSGLFAPLSMRAACRAAAGEDLVEATSHQSEFTEGVIEGTMVGFWSPDHVRSVGIPGYHLHFVSTDRSIGGHVLDLAGRGLRVDLDVERDVHVAMPTTKEFLDADLAADATASLEIAESAVADRPDRR